MSNLPKLNVRLLNRIKKHILAEPKRYNQAKWGRQVSDYEFEDNKGPACKTQGCIAGWAVFLSVPKGKWASWWVKASNFNFHLSPGVPKREATGIPAKAQKLLGITTDEAARLFDLNPEHQMGLRGALEGAAKIDALIASRAVSRR
jgi:hypothetical protein